MFFNIDGVEVISNIDDLTEEEARKYVNYVLQNANCPDPLKKVIATFADDGKIDVDYVFNGPKFERIRRITGYLTGDVSSWNNAKRSEERERVKHSIQDFGG